MKKLVLVMALATALAGCATASMVLGATVSQQTADEGIRTGGLAVTAANAYLALPRCSAGVSPLKGACKAPSSIVPVQSARNKLLNAISSLETATEAAQAQGTGVGVASALYNAVTASKSSVVAALPSSAAATLQ